MSSINTMESVNRVAIRKAAESNDATRHRCFVSYHVDDEAEVKAFLESFGDAIIATCVGVTEDDDFVNSTDPDYIKRRIREKYLSSTTVTIVLVGRCTKARKFVDWEIASSLRNDPTNKRSGLLAINLPSAGKTALAPARVGDNLTAGDESKSYAKYVVYPSSKAELRALVSSAFAARDGKSQLVNNTRALLAANGSC